MKKLTCSSCRREIANDKGATKFLCPNCGKYQIVRCFNCRELGSKYKCPSCNFEGPN
ncbi:DUF1610 domain-containing protein [Candidatus Woesearchaeota archaeon]|nr:DUF1610 domain-containing protein [Candidatus Woesearchaeota archaeon]